MPFDKSQRLRVPEQMDADDVDPAALRGALAFIRRINTMLGYNRAIARVVNREITRIPSSQRPKAVLDVAAGSGDLLVEIRRHARRSQSIPLHLYGVDRHAATIDEGRRVTGSNVRFIRGDALSLPFEDASVDVVVSTLFLHHLSDEHAIAALAEMRRVARYAVVTADLLRSRRAYAWITLFTARATAMVKHDARASVAHAFTMREMRALARAAGMPGASLTRTFGHRSLLIWRRTPPAAVGHLDASGT